MIKTEKKIVGCIKKYVKNENTYNVLKLKLHKTDAFPHIHNIKCNDKIDITLKKPVLWERGDNIGLNLYIKDISLI